jgi:hypothetical protein
MKLIGAIKQLQIQREPLKAGESANRSYNPAPILCVDQLKLTTRGLYGVNSDGNAIVDVHNLDHPRSRNRENLNGISINFTSHYTMMKERFGSHVSAGCAGENILVESDTDYTQTELGSQIMIRLAKTGGFIPLINLHDAPPCEPFSRFVIHAAMGGGALKTTLQFLSCGMRGFYATLAEADEVLIQTGDEVYVASND